MDKSVNKCLLSKNEIGLKAPNPKWVENAVLEAVFSIFVKDGLASISKEEDKLASVTELCGDMFNPEVNPDIEASRLKSDERKFKQSIYRKGVWIHELLVMGESLDVIGGFVGDDFYGSGYDNDYYRVAIAGIKHAHPKYVSDLLAHAESHGAELNEGMTEQYDQ